MPTPMLRSTASRIDSRLPISSSACGRTPASTSMRSVSWRVVEPGSRISRQCRARAASGTLPSAASGCSRCTASTSGSRPSSRRTSARIVEALRGGGEVDAELVERLQHFLGIADLHRHLDLRQALAKALEQVEHVVGAVAPRRRLPCNWPLLRRKNSMSASCCSSARTLGSSAARRRR